MNRPALPARISFPKWNHSIAITPNLTFDCCKIAEKDVVYRRKLQAGSALGNDTAQLFMHFDPRP
jgi:hypothetical protein